jgi:hypothetical protein
MMTPGEHSIAGGEEDAPFTVTDARENVQVAPTGSPEQESVTL